MDFAAREAREQKAGAGPGRGERPGKCVVSAGGGARLRRSEEGEPAGLRTLPGRPVLWRKEGGGDTPHPPALGGFQGDPAPLRLDKRLPGLCGSRQLLRSHYLARRPFPRPRSASSAAGPPYIHTDEGTRFGPRAPAGQPVRRYKDATRRHGPPLAPESGPRGRLPGTAAKPDGGRGAGSPRASTGSFRPSGALRGRPCPGGGGGGGRGSARRAGRALRSGSRARTQRRGGGRRSRGVAGPPQRSWRERRSAVESPPGRGCGRGRGGGRSLGSGRGRPPALPRGQRAGPRPPPPSELSAGWSISESPRGARRRRARKGTNQSRQEKLWQRGRVRVLRVGFWISFGAEVNLVSSWLASKVVYR